MNSPASIQSDDSGLLDRLTAQFLPDDFDETDIQQLFRARVVVALSFAVSIFGPIYAALVYFLSGELSQLVATLIATTGVITTPWLLRRGFSFVVQGNWMTLCGVSLFVYVASQNLGPSVLIWQVVFVVLLAFIAGRRSALAWLVVMSGFVLYFYLSLSPESGGEDVVFSRAEILWEMSIIIGMFIAVMMLTLTYEAIKNWALEQFRKKEAHTRAILEAAPDGIVTVTDEGHIGEFNSSAEELFDYDHSDVREAPITSLVPEISDAPNQPIVDDEELPAESNLFAEPDSDIDDDARGLDRWVGDTWEAEAVRKDGSRFPAELSVTPVEDDDNQYVAILRDITRRKQNQRALREARDQAIEANEAKSRFLANISHELRTPLNAIIGYSELVGQDLEMMDEPRLAEDIQKVEHAGNHLLSLINEILDLSKVEAGEMQVYTEEVALQKLVDRVSSTVEPLIDDNDNRLRIDIEQAPETMEVDRKKLRQILINLLSNAAKFTEEGLIRVDAFAETEQGREQVVFEVSDRGIGIPKEKLENLFEAFSQADESTTRDFGGTGLGLTICREFTDLMCGTIDVESTVGEGSTFRVTLPVDVDEARARKQQQKQQEQDHDSLESMERETEKPALPTDAPTVLVIDDDPTVHRLMERFLEREGFGVETSTGGPDALKKARNIDPDIITLDVLMPEVDGWGMLERIKADEQLADIPVVMLTIVDDRNLGFSLGATDYLTKPIETDRLVEVLSAHLDEDGDHPILIAEDDDDTRDILRRTVEQSGWEAVCTTDGREALDHIEEGNQPSAILLDLMMPRLDGFEVLEQLRARPTGSDIPVIVVSAADLSEAEREMIDEHTAKLFKKGDYAKEQLVEELETALQ